MQGHSRVAHGAMRWLNTIAAVLAIVAQLSGALSPLGESRQDKSSAPHVELGGTSVHHAHSESTCAICQARSVHAAVARAAAPAPILALSTVPLAQAAEEVRTPELRSLSNPRAPPSF